MTRNIFLFITILQCFFLPVPAQIPAPIVITDLQALAGSWEGHLEYLDYRTNQTRVTLSATLEIKGRKNTLALFFEFFEPSGKKVKNKEIIRMTADQQQLLLDGTAYSCIERKHDRGSRKLILTGRGLDNRKPATLRQTITMTGKQFRITKEVLPDGDTDFFVRNEYVFEKNTDITRLTFSVDMKGVAAALKNPESIGIRGSLPPLSWEKTFSLKDDDGDGIFSAAISFPGTPPRQLIEYKYVYGDLSWEIDGSDNRVLLTGENNKDDDPDKWNVSKPLTAQQCEVLNKVAPQDFKQDIAILKKALTTLHPGLYRYQDEKSLAELFRTTDRRIAKVETLGDAYAEISRLTAAIRCGHTHPNPYNQGARVRQMVLSQADKIPFAFRLIDNRLIVTMNASDEERIETGTEILAINGIPVPVIIDSLMTYSRADGHNDHKRLDNLQIKGYGKFEDFDILFPLLFPPQNGQYTFEARNGDQAPSFRFSLPTISRQDRSEMLASRYDDLPETYDDTWAFRMLNQATGYLQLGTFVTWNMEMDWKAFLSDAFHQLEKKNIPNLIIDIPLFASFPLTEQPDQGVMPDIRVEPSVEDIRRGVDTGLKATLQLVRKSPN